MLLNIIVLFIICLFNLVESIEHFTPNILLKFDKFQNLTFNEITDIMKDHAFEIKNDSIYNLYCKLIRIYDMCCDIKQNVYDCKHSCESKNCSIP